MEPPWQQSLPSQTPFCILPIALRNPLAKGARLVKTAPVLPLTARRYFLNRAGPWLRLLRICLWAASTASLNLYAGDNPNFFYDFRRVKELEQNPITAVIQTRDGYLWQGTYTGLMRYDGVRVVAFDSATTPGLENGRVTSLFEDPSDALWIGHETGEISLLKDGVFRPAGRVSDWPGGAVEAITMDEAGDIWLLSDLGLLIRMRDGYRLEPPGGASPSRKVFVSREPSGRLWVTANGMVRILERGQLVPFGFGGGETNSFFERVVAARDGGLWVMRNGRINKWRDGHWVADLGDCPCEHGFVTELLETRSGALLAGTVKDGLYLLSAGAPPLHFSRTNGLSHDWVRALWEDREGIIWIGTGGGLDGLQHRKVKMLNPPDAWQGRAVLSFFVRPQGDVWVGSEGAGLYLYHLDGDQWTCYTESNGLPNLFVWSVMETRTGQLLVGTWGGGLLVKTDDGFASPGELGQITAPVVALFESTDGAVWIGTTSGLYRSEAGKVTWSAGRDKLRLPDVRAIAESSDHTIWFGMLGGGLGQLKNGVLRQFRKADGLSSDFILSLYPETDGTLWIGTSDNGLCRFRDGKFATVSARQGMLASIISEIAEDGAGNFWMGSHHGILRVSKADLNRCADGKVASIRCLSYGEAEGLTSMKCSGGFQPNVCRTPDGRLWFPTAKGLAVIDPGSFTTNTVPPPVVIEELIVEGQLVKLPAPSEYGPHRHPPVLEIPAGKQRFEFHYAGLSFPDPEKVIFRYKLEGLEDQSIDGGTKRVAQYSYLPPGNYTFRVAACNNDEVWNGEGASLSFKVLPHFWQTWWFKSVLILIGTATVAGVAMGVTRQRVRRKLDQLERQRALERERARIARDIHDDLGASLTRITLLSQSARGDLENPQQAAADLDQIYTTARELTRAMDEIVWAVNPKHDTLDSLVAYLGRFAQNFLSTAGIRCRLDVPLQLPARALTVEIRHNLFLAFKEALNNVVKHAQASEVRVTLDIKPGEFMLAIADNGRGFDWSQQKARVTGATDSLRSDSGNGLLNMRKRLEEIGGRCEWETAPGEGTRVKLLLQWKI